MKTNTLFNKFQFGIKKGKLSIFLTIFLVAGIIMTFQLVSAKNTSLPKTETSPMHPVFALLDKDGQNVIKSGLAVSTMNTCGGKCHDTAFIVSHSFHADLGLSTYKTVSNNWNASAGIFGKWDSLSYRYLSQTNDELLDLGTAEWLMKYGERIPGGGPAVTSRNGAALTDLIPDVKNPETAVLDPATGKISTWDWKKSGTMEMDCFLCHISNPDTTSRASEIHAGKFSAANTATLLNTGLVTKSNDGFQWNLSAFDEAGNIKTDFVTIQDPTNGNCSVCHGEVHTSTQQPLTVSACDLKYPQTALSGQVMASQKISESGVNLSGKAALTRSWDIHTERGLKCTECHFSINNPVHSQKAAGTSPSHLMYDPRKLSIGEYLKYPEHDFARGQSAQYTVEPENKGTMRRCESCHDASKSHADWLPYSEQHMAVVACESCHIPQLFAPAVESYDWTVVHLDGSPANLCRGIQGGSDTVNNLVTGFKPVLMQRTNIDGKTLLTPYNLVSSWYWVYKDAAGNVRPVREIDLRSAFLVDGTYAAPILKSFDANANGLLEENELRITTKDQENVVAGQLEKIGLKEVHIEGMVQPYSINHDVARGEFATRECNTCHNSDSRVTQPLQLANFAPAGVIPQFVSDNNIHVSGEIIKSADGSLNYQPATMKDGVYVFGRDRIMWIDLFGALAFAGTLLAVGGHGTLRYIGSLKNKKNDLSTKKVYMYESYERFWHWLQTFSIIFLLFTGLIIHRPDIFGAFSFPHMVTIHNVLAAILVINAVFSLFWHLTTGEIQQYIPRPVGFFDDAIVQTKFYINGIFKGDAHPFEKRKDKKLNPLQQATYFGLLNVLLPLQVITGALMWSVQKWPTLTSWFGGLTVLAPFHSLVAWLLGTFVVAHVYLTTTGATPLEAMRGMVTGWEEIESHTHSEENETKK
ncbi:MAG: cytochrome b/b6 domain-containing protein [Chloroflexota bacterium]